MGVRYVIPPLLSPNRAETAEHHAELESQRAAKLRELGADPDSIVE